MTDKKTAKDLLDYIDSLRPEEAKILNEIADQVVMNQLTNAGRDFFHSEVYTNTNNHVEGRQEIVMFNGGTLAIPFTHVDECKGWYRDNNCTCPKDDYEDDD